MAALAFAVPRKPLASTFPGSNLIRRHGRDVRSALRPRSEMKPKPGRDSRRPHADRVRGARCSPCCCRHRARGHDPLAPGDVEFGGQIVQLTELPFDLPPGSPRAAARSASKPATPAPGPLPLAATDVLRAHLPLLELASGSGTAPFNAYRPKTAIGGRIRRRQVDPVPRPSSQAHGPSHG